MGWYDFFSNFYDKSLEPLYAEQRVAAADALELEPSSVVLDLPTGTGQSLDVLAPRAAVVVGSDFSAGMLKRAAERVARNGWSHVHLLEADVHAIDKAKIESVAGQLRGIDRIHVFLGMTAFPEWEKAFAQLWDLLEPGGRIVIVDVHAEKLGFQGWMVNLVARADIRRRWWEPLERVAKNYERKELRSRPEHGGKIYLATGIKG